MGRTDGQNAPECAVAQVLDALTENKRHHELLDGALGSLDEIPSREETQQLIAAEIAKNAPLLKKPSDWRNRNLNLDEKAARKIVEVLVKKIGEARQDRGHELRRRSGATSAGCGMSFAPG